MKNNEIAIRVSGVSKSFKLPHQKTKSVKGLFINMFRGKRTFEKQQVLKDVSFEVKKGEFFGVVGRNGGGKSTLLKILAQIYVPDNGKININGTLTPFIELGVGFNPDLTGRENVYLNGALLGFNRTAMDALYDDIVKFAELEKFMDQKLRNYSSGMQVRLAFSVAIQARTEILLIDEVLAVGDSNFQKKCFAVFERFKHEGRTVIFISHSMEMVTRFCDRAILLKDGKVFAEGEPEVVAAEYNMLNNESQKNNSSRLEVATRREAHIIDNVLSVFTSNDKLIEIGSANGRHVELINSIGIKTIGVDRLQRPNNGPFYYYDIEEITATADITGMLVLDNQKSIDVKSLFKIFDEVKGGKFKNVTKIYIHLPFHIYQKRAVNISSNLGSPIELSEITSKLESLDFIQTKGGLYGADEPNQYAEGIYERFDKEKTEKLWQS